MESEGLSGQLAGVQGAGVGQGAVGLALDVTLLLPLGEVTESGQLSGVLHPLDDLEHGHKVDIVAVNHLINEANQLLDKTLVLLEPRSMEMQTCN